MKDQITTKKMTPDDFLIQEIDDLIEIYNKNQFAAIDYNSEPDLYIKQKKRMTFDILCDRLSPDNSREYEELIDSVIDKSMRSGLNPYEITQKVTEIGQAVIKDLKEVTPQILIERAIHAYCKKHSITTSESVALAIQTTVMPGTNFYIYIRKFAIFYLECRNNEYIDFSRKMLSFWRQSKGSALPKTKKRYLWTEAIWLCKAKTGACYTDILWEKIKFEFE